MISCFETYFYAKHVYFTMLSFFERYFKVLYVYLTASAKQDTF